MGKKRREGKKGFFLSYELNYTDTERFVHSQMDTWKCSSLIPLELLSSEEQTMRGPSPGWSGQASLEWEFPHLTDGD